MAWAVVLAAGDAEVVLGRARHVRVDLALIDALARLQLAALRVGCTIRLRDASADLCALLDFVGLTDAVLPREAGREAELWEQVVGVEEVVDPGDPSV